MKYHIISLSSLRHQSVLSSWAPIWYWKLQSGTSYCHAGTCCWEACIQLLILTCALYYGDLTRILRSLSLLCTLPQLYRKWLLWRHIRPLNSYGITVKGRWCQRKNLNISKKSNGKPLISWSRIQRYFPRSLETVRETMKCLFTDGVKVKGSNCLLFKICYSKFVKSQN